MSDYIVKFDKRYNKAKKIWYDTPWGLQIIRQCWPFLQRQTISLNISSDVKYASMKSALQRIFGGRASEPTELSANLQSITIKQEPVY